MDLVFEAMKKEEEKALARLVKQKKTSQLPSSLRRAAAMRLSRHSTSQDGSSAATALVAVVAPPRPLSATAAAAAEKVGSPGAPSDDHHHHQDDHHHQDSLQARINRDVTNMDSDVLALRLASMTSLIQSLESLTVVMAGVTNNKHKKKEAFASDEEEDEDVGMHTTRNVVCRCCQSVLETHYKAIFKRLGDPSESCRRLAIRLCFILFQHGGQQAFSSVLLAHFFPVSK